MMYYGGGTRITTNYTCCCTSTVCTCYQPGTTSVTAGPDSNQIIITVTQGYDEGDDWPLMRPARRPRERPPRFANHRKTVHHRPPAYRRACY